VAPLLLSQRAQDRAYFPEGILDHHHAIQYITFSPPFDSEHGGDGDENDENDSPPSSSANTAASPSKLPPFQRQTTHKSSATLESQYDAYASLLGSNNSTADKRNNNPGILSKIAGPLSRKQKSVDKEGTGQQAPPKPNQPKTKPKASKIKTSTRGPKPEPKKTGSETSTCGPVGCFSKFNCLRASAAATVVTKKSKKQPPQPDDAAHAIIKPSPQTSMASLSEEDEKRWLAYSMKPIDEDQSLANGSVVSMSAPLLSPSLEIE